MGGNDSTSNGLPRRWLRIDLWMTLGLLAATQFVLDVILLFRINDSDHLETTLAYVAAGPLNEGPLSLYGPYGKGNLRVLIQAPLYYRLTALGAWPFVVAGFPAVETCVTVGRTISVVAFAGVLVLMARISRLDGTPVRAGVWAVLLALSSAVIRNSPVTLRPDLLGIFLQTLGAYLVLKALRNPIGSPGRLTLAYLAFGLAVCVKQHYVATMIGSSILLLRSWISNSRARRSMERAALVGVAVTSTYFVIEEVVSAGRMFHSILVVPSLLREGNPDKWFHLLGMSFEVIMRSVGLLILAASVVRAAPRSVVESGLDRVLWLFFGLEAALFGVLCYGNGGAWINYAIPAVVYGCLLLGRALSRVMSVRLPAWRALLIALAGVVALLSNLDLARRALLGQTRQLAEVKALLRDRRLSGTGRQSIYFVGLPELNRFLGHPEWVHDEWLYGQLERIKAAPPRSIWLRPALTSGPVHIVVVPNDPPFPIPLNPPVVPGLTETLPELGYARAFSIGRLQVWERRRRPRPPGGLFRPHATTEARTRRIAANRERAHKLRSTGG